MNYSSKEESKQERFRSSGVLHYIKTIPTAMTSAFPFSSEQSSSYYEFLGVSSCQDVVHLYRLLWSSTVLNIIGLFLGIITAAILGAFKDMVRPTVFCLMWGFMCLLMLSNG